MLTENRQEGPAHPGRCLAVSSKLESPPGPPAPAWPLKVLDQHQGLGKTEEQRSAVLFQPLVPPALFEKVGITPHLSVAPASLPHCSLSLNPRGSAGTASPIGLGPSPRAAPGYLRPPLT